MPRRVAVDERGLMTSKYKSRWDPSRRAQYMDDKADEAEQLHSNRTGGLIAQDLNRLWASMADDEVGLIDFLLSDDGPETFIADFDEPVFKCLVEKGILQLPRGVGGNWMRAVRTGLSR